MDAGFDQNEAEFGIFVFTIALEMLSYGDGLLHVNVSKKEKMEGLMLS